MDFQLFDTKVSLSFNFISTNLKHPCMWSLYLPQLNQKSFILWMRSIWWLIKTWKKGLSNKLAGIINKYLRRSVYWVDISHQNRKWGLLRFFLFLQLCYINGAPMTQISLASRESVEISGRAVWLTPQKFQFTHSGQRQVTTAFCSLVTQIYIGPIQDNCTRSEFLAVSSDLNL